MIYCEYLKTHHCISDVWLLRHFHRSLWESHMILSTILYYHQTFFKNSEFQSLTGSQRIWIKDSVSSLNTCHQFSSVAQSCLTPCDTMDCSTWGLPVHHQLPELDTCHEKNNIDKTKTKYQMWVLKIINF